MIDIHAHLCFPEFDSDREKVVKKCEELMTAVIVSSARYDEGLCALKLCKNHKKLFSTIGYHPTEGGDSPETVMELIRKNRAKIVGIGEVGLDYHWEKDEKKRERQKEIFSRFISLASKLEKPLVIHSWDAEQDCYEMVKGFNEPVIFHCFSGQKELALEILKHSNHFISFSTQILFSKNHRKLAKSVPLERMTLETDAPFLSPIKYFQEKGEKSKLLAGFDPKLNYPWNVRLAAEKIAEIKGIKAGEVLEKTTENAKGVFGLEI
jgi:TatD DNase family protein